MVILKFRLATDMVVMDFFIHKKILGWWHETVTFHHIFHGVFLIINFIEDWLVLDWIRPNDS